MLFYVCIFFSATTWPTLVNFSSSPSSLLTGTYTINRFRHLMSVFFFFLKKKKNISFLRRRKLWRKLWFSTPENRTDFIWLLCTRNFGKKIPEKFPGKEISGVRSSMTSWVQDLTFVSNTFKKFCVLRVCLVWGCFTGRTPE